MAAPPSGSAGSTGAGTTGAAAVSYTHLDVYKRQDQQKQAVREISHRTTDVARSANVTADAAAIVLEASNQTGETASESLGAAQNLANQAVKLKQSANEFLQKIRA